MGTERAKSNFRGKPMDIRITQEHDNQPLQSKGVALLCDWSGAIIEVLRDDIGLVSETHGTL